MPARLFGLCLLVLAGCGEVLYLEADAPRACLTVSDVAVPGSPVARRETLGDRLQYSLDEALLPADGEFQVELVSLTLQGGAGADFNFIDTGTVSAASSSAADAKLQPLVTYQRSRPVAGSVELTQGNPVDLTPYLRGRDLFLDVSVTGTLPRNGFAMDVSACFRVLARTGALVP